MDELTARFDRLVTDVGDGLPVLGERLLLLGAGPLPIAEAVGAALALDESGRTVLIAAFHRVAAEAADQLRDQLTEIGALREEDLAELEQGPFLGRPLKERVGLVFGGTEKAPSEINQSQRLLLVVEEAPSEETSRRLAATLAGSLDGVYEWTDRGVERILLPSPGRPTPAAKATPLPRPVTAERPASYWLSLGIVVAGVVLIAVAIVRAGNPTDPSAGAIVESPLRTIAIGVPPNVTQTYLVGQKRVVRLSDGQLAVLLPTESGLKLILDDNNQGRTWQEPVAVTDSPIESLSVAADSSDRLHIVTSDGAQVAYTTLFEEGTGWGAGPSLVLDTQSTSPVLDIAWDEAADLAHAVWIHEDTAGSQPIWASVLTADGEPPALAQTQVLADPGNEIPPLANVAVNNGSGVLVTYNHPDESGGWYSRTGTISEEEDVRFPVFIWGNEEKIPVAARYGGAAVVIDRMGVAHLVLRDDGAARLMYFKKRRNRAWSAGEPAAQGNTPLEVDQPGIAVDAASRLIYLAFQRGGDRPEVQVVIRDPATGWEGPYQIVTEQDLPEGAVFPTLLPTARGPAIILWTTAGPSPKLQAVRVTAP